MSEPTPPVQADIRDTLLATKLLIPVVTPRLLARPRLSDTLQKAHPHSRLVVVSAPAGYGKTTVIVDWLQRHHIAQGEKVAWLSLDEGDNEPVRFWDYFVAALETSQPGLSQGLQSLLHSQQTLPVENVLAILINHLTNLKQPVTLVLDDYHLITNSQIHRGVAYLLDHLPPDLHLVITTRTDPPSPIPLTRLRVRGQLTEIRAADLRFTLEESDVFFNSVMGLPVLPQSVRELENKTEGWIAALQLAALLMRSYSDTEKFIKAFNGSQRFLLDYLAEEVLERQPEAIQTFLLQTSIVDRLNASLAEELTGCTDGHSMLRQLEQANLFLIALDEEHGWYRYHHLFQHYLRNRLEHTQAEHVPLLHRWAARWYQAHQMAVPAIEHALAAQDFGYAAELVDHTIQSMYERRELKTLLRWLQALPDEFIYQRPHMSCNFAWVLILLNQPEAAVPYIEAEARGLEQIETRQALPPDLVQALRGEIAAVWAFIQRTRGNYTESIELGQQALGLILKPQAFLRCSIMVNQAGCYSALEDWVAAEQHAVEVEALSWKCGSSYFRLLGIASQARIQAQQGRLQPALASYRRALQMTELDFLPLMSQARSELGSLQRELNELDEAAQNLSRAIEQLESGDDSSWIGAYVDLLRVRLAQDRLDEAETLLEKLEQTACKDVQTKLRLVGQAKIWLGLTKGDLANLENLVAVGRLDTPGVARSELEHEQLLVARLRLAQNMPAEALKLAAEVVQSAQESGRTGPVIESLALQAAALYMQNQRGPAANLLLQALQLAEPQGFVRVFTDAATPVTRLLYEERDWLITSGIAAAYLSKLLAASNIEAVTIPKSLEIPLSPPLVALPSKPATSKLVEPLTEREQAVLQLLVTTSLNTTEMADQLSVAVSTVRTHIKNIYSKLEVQNRFGAIQRSQELGLCAKSS